MALGWDGAVVIVVLSVGLIAMLGDWVAPHLTFTGMVGVLMAATVIDTKAGVAGFSNTGVLTVVVLYAVAEGISQTGGLDRIMSRVLGSSASSARAALVRMMLPVAISSAFLNNTPIVALMIPVLISWGRRCSISPKKLLYPLSLASIFGGTCTLIGTSTNLVISGLQGKRYAGTPDAAFGFFDITPYGIPYGTWGFVFVLFVGFWLLPNDTGSRPREDLLLAARVAAAPGAAAQLVGHSLRESGLLSLSGVRLLSVVRGGRVIFKAAAEQAPSATSGKGAGGGAVGGLLGRLLAAGRRGGRGRADASVPAAGHDAGGGGGGGKDVEAALGGGGGGSGFADDDDVAAGDQGGNGGGAIDGRVSVAPPPPAHGAADDAAAAAATAVVLQPGDLLHFQGDLRQLMGHAERLGLEQLTASGQELDRVLQLAARGTLAPQPPAGVASGGGALLAPFDEAAVGGGGGATAAASLAAAGGASTSAARRSRLFARRLSAGGGGASQRVDRRVSVGFSGATMWLLRAVVKKGSPLVGQRVGDVDWWGGFGVIVVGAQLGARKKGGVAPAVLRDLVLSAGDLLILSARNDLDVDAPGFSAALAQVDLVRDTKPKDFVIAMRVVPGRGGAANKDLAQNGMQDIVGLHIVALTRPATGELFVDLSPHFQLLENDVLWFATDIDGVKYLRKDARLEAVQAEDAAKLKGRVTHRHLVQATVAPDSVLIGHTARQLRFRDFYEASVLAIHRHSGHVDLVSAAEVELAAGDVLLLEADEGFTRRFQTNPAFGLVADVARSSPLKVKLMWPAILLVAGMVATQMASGFTGVTYIDLLPCAILTAAAMLLIGCLNSQQALGSVDWTVYITVAFAFGLSTAMEKTGVAQGIAGIFVALSKKIGGRTAALGSIYLVTGLLSEVLTNNAAAALMYPIAASIGDDMGITPKVVSITVMLGASAAFISPFGYQCNLMVYSAGNYKTIDFVRIGVLLQVWQLVGACVILSIPEQALWLSVASLVVIALSVGYAVASTLRAKAKARRSKAAALAAAAAAAPTSSSGAPSGVLDDAAEEDGLLGEAAAAATPGTARTTTAAQ